VVKHAVLVAVLDELLASLPSSGGLSFCDAFSGGGEYQLSKEGEWAVGVGALAATQRHSWLQRVNTYLQACWSQNGSVYPGSSLTAARRASAVGRTIHIRAWDTDPICSNDLQQVLSAQTPVAQVAAVTGRMPAGAAAGADLLFVDPPKRQGWQRTLQGLVPKGSEPNALMIWLPVNGSKRGTSSWKPTTTAAAPQGMMSPLWSVEVLWETPRAAQPTVGCELLLALPPTAWRVAAEAAAEVVQVMGEEWTMRLRHLS